MFKGLSSSEFAKFVIDNMGIATLSNAMTIANHFDTEDGYAFDVFLKDTQDYLKTLATDSKFDINKCYELLGICCKSMRMYKTSSSKIYIIDNFIIDIWSVCNGH